MSLPDVQNVRGDYGFPLKAGVSNLKIPILVKTQEGDLVTTIAEVAMHVNLSHELRGINMSRLPIILNTMHDEEWIIDNLKVTLIEMLEVMEASQAMLVFKFPYFYTKSAPMTSLSGKAFVDATFAGYLDSTTGNYNFTLTVEVPVMTLCPCSKEISDNNAHNQRATVKMSVDYGNRFVWIEDLIAYAERSASSPLFPILKREDEKHVTEYAYDHPKFVEDLARDVARHLQYDQRIKAFKVGVVSEESIHQHNACAEIDGGLHDIWSLL